jgi:hypothetical protein
MFRFNKLFSTITSLFSGDYPNAGILRVYSYRVEGWVRGRVKNTKVVHGDVLANGSIALVPPR